MKIFAHRMYGSVMLMVTEEIPDYRVNGGRFRAAKALEFEERGPGLVPEPTITLAVDEAQLLLDQLWHMGLRPSAGVSSTGQDAAQKAHISDLRSIVRSLLKIGEP